MNKQTRTHIRYTRVACAVIVLGVIIGFGVYLLGKSAGKRDAKADSKGSSSYSYPDVSFEDSKSEQKPSSDLTALKDAMNAKIADYGGEWSVYLKNMDTGEYFSINDKDVYPASMIKLFAMGACYQQIEDGKINENDWYSTIHSMAALSNNNSFNKMIWTIGKDYLTKWCRDNGYTRTAQYHGLFPSDNGEGLQTSDKKNVTCASDVGHMLEDIYNGKCVSKQASEKMLKILTEQYWRNKIPMGIPYGPIIANKSGDTDDVSHDGAIVYSDGADYVLVIMCDYPQNASLQGHRFIELSKMAYEYFNK